MSPPCEWSGDGIGTCGKPAERNWKWGTRLHIPLCQEHAAFVLSYDPNEDLFPIPVDNPTDSVQHCPRPMSPTESAHKQIQLAKLVLKRLSALPATDHSAALKLIVDEAAANGILLPQ